MPPEFRLLAHLVAHTGKVLTHRSLLREGWVPRTSRVAITCESAWQVAAEAQRVASFSVVWDDEILIEEATYPSQPEVGEVCTSP